MSSKQSSTNKMVWKLFLASLLSTTALSGIAFAQDDTSSNEVIVTATKRAENIQNIPLSVQALGAQTLDDHQVSSFDDYANLLPSVSFQSFGPSQAQLYFRGVSSGGDGLHAGSQPTASTYVDDTPLTTIANTVDLHVFDIARVEALSGPQGTLFGATALSGVLRIITNQPDPSGVSAGMDVEANKYTDGGPGGTIEGYLNVPVASNAALRVVGFYESKGGYIDNVPGERTYTLGDTDPNTNLTVNNNNFVEKDFNDEQTYGGRAALRVDLNDSWTSTTSVMGQIQRANGSFLFDPKVGDLKVHDFAPTRNDDQWGLLSETITGHIANFDVVYSGSYFDRRVENIADYSYYTVAYDAFAGSYYTNFPDGAGGFLDPTQRTHFIDDYSKQTHELRFVSPAENRLRFTGGLFYQRQTDFDQADYFTPGVNAVIQFAPTQATIPGLGDDIFARRLHRTDVDKAVFGELSYDIIPSLTATIGGRWFRAENSLNGLSGFASNFDNSCVATTGIPCANIDKRFSEDGETHKASLAYHLDDNRMVYFTYSTGYRPGGANRRAGVNPYTSDTLANYELGWKSMLFDHHLRLNADVFFEQWDNMQFGLTPAGSVGVVNVYNAGNAEIRGIEGDFSWILPARITLSGSATYLDAKLVDDFCAPGASGNPDCTTGIIAAPSGTRLPNQPRFKTTITARHDFTLGTLDAFIQGTGLYQGATRTFLTDEDFASVGGTKAFATLDLSTGVNFGSSALEFYVHNVTDERGILSRNAACAPTAGLCGPFARSYPTEPRIIGVRASKNF